MKAFNNILSFCGFMKFEILARACSFMLWMFGSYQLFIPTRMVGHAEIYFRQPAIRSSLTEHIHLSVLVAIRVSRSKNNAATVFRRLM